MKPSDLSRADIEALTELRLRMQIRVDKAGRFAESLQHLTDRGALCLSTISCGLLEEQLTDAHLALGFTKGGGTGPEGQRYTWAPHWMWAQGNPGDPSALLREAEGRSTDDPDEVEWDDFAEWMEKVWHYNDGPTIAEAASKFGVSHLCMVDAVDGFYWAFRVAHPGKPIAEHTIELDGE